MSREKLEQTLKNWQAKLAEYEHELSITASPETKFELNTRIKECRQKIQELESELNKCQNRPVELPERGQKWFSQVAVAVVAVLLVGGSSIAYWLKHSQTQKDSTTSPTPNEVTQTQAPTPLEICYFQLEDLLKEGKWEEANKKTAELMLKVAGRESEKSLDYEAINSFSCPDLKEIDQLWVEYSNGRFGFSVQKRIWESEEGKTGEDNLEIYEKFGDRVRWRDVEGKWLEYSQVTFSLDAPQGHLPWFRRRWWGVELRGQVRRDWANRFKALLSRCDL